MNIITYKIYFAIYIRFLNDKHEYTVQIDKK